MAAGLTDRSPGTRGFRCSSLGLSVVIDSHGGGNVFAGVRSRRRIGQGFKVAKLPNYRAPSHQEASTLLVRPEVMAVGVPLAGSKNMSCCTQTLCFPCPPRSGARPCGVTYTI